MQNTPVSLLERLQQAPDPDAWGRFARLATPFLLLCARRLGLQEHDAADLVQEVFAVLVRKLPDFRYDSQRSFRAWLKTILLNKWRDQCKRLALPLDATRDVNEVADAADPDSVCEEADFRRHLLSRALELIRGDFQAVSWQAFWQHGVLGRSAAEVAAELGISPGAVYSARFRVLDRLRQELRGLVD